MEKTCYFFGTFNPIHTGHLMMAQCGLNQYGPALGFRTVTFVPAGNPPHRQQDNDLAPAKERLRMVRLATASNPAFRVSDIELHHEGMTYTYEILQRLAPEEGSVPFIIGSDAFLTLGTWHRATELLERVYFLQVPRPESNFSQEVLVDGKTVPTQTALVDMPALTLSSTWIRRQLREHPEHDLRYVLPEPVRQYIRDNRLYLL